MCRESEYDLLKQKQLSLKYMKHLYLVVQSCFIVTVLLYCSKDLGGKKMATVCTMDDLTHF